MFDAFDVFMPRDDILTSLRIIDMPDVVIDYVALIFDAAPRRCRAPEPRAGKIFFVAADVDISSCLPRATSRWPNAAVDADAARCHAACLMFAILAFTLRHLRANVMRYFL